MPIRFVHVFPPIVGPCAPQGGNVLLIKVISKLCSGCRPHERQICRRPRF